MKNKGLFITIEGPDGSGKSTQIAFLRDYFKEKGMEVVFTREPGGTVIGEQIRSIILNKDNMEMADLTETMLYAAARAQIISELIKPNLEAGKVVICDRFVDSSIAYQGYGRGLGSIVKEINDFVIKNCTPDITLLLSLDSEEGMKRIEEKRSAYEEKDRLELEALDFHKRVLDGYLEMAKTTPRIKVVNANQEIPKVSEDIKKIIEEFV